MHLFYSDKVFTRYSNFTEVIVPGMYCVISTNEPDLGCHRSASAGRGLYCRYS